MFKKTAAVLILILLFFSVAGCARDILDYGKTLNFGSIFKSPGSINPAPLNDKDKSETQPHSAGETNNLNEHLHYTRPDIILSEIIENSGLENFEEINLYVDLKTRTMFIKNGEKVLKEYRISAGTKTDEGDKEKEGDLRTPRGEFYICTKAKYSPPKGYLGSRWMLLSYPNTEDAERGLKNNLITKKVYNQINKAIADKKIPPQNTILGSAIGIHGGARPGLKRDWTAGCIGMYDQDVEEIFEYIKEGTKVVIN